MSYEDLARKIRALLALSKSANENESALAMQRAQQMAIQYGIDLASIPATAEKVEEEAVVRQDLSVGNKINPTQRLITYLLQAFYNVRVITTGGRYGGRQVVLIGTTSDVEMAKFVNGYLAETFQRLWTEYYRTKQCHKSVRNSYIYGLYQGLRNKLAEAQSEAKATGFARVEAEKGSEEAARVKQCYALVVQNKEERVQKAVAEFFPRLRTGKARINHNTNYDVVAHGRVAGRSINVNRPIDGRSALQA